MLRAVPGFHVFYDRIYEFAGVRGFGRLGDFRSRLLVLVDDYRTNDVIYDSGFIGSEATRWDASELPAQAVRRLLG